MEAAAIIPRRERPSFLLMQHGKIIGEDYPRWHSPYDAYKIYSGQRVFGFLRAQANKRDHPLDDKCAYIPEWRAIPEMQITLRQLLNFNSVSDADNHCMRWV